MTSEKTPMTAPNLFRFDDADGSAWVGRRQFFCAPVPGRPGAVSLSRPELQEAAAMAWQIGFNAKAAEVRRDLRTISRRFDPDENLLPYDLLDIPETPPWYDRPLKVFGFVFFAALTLPLIVVLAVALSKLFW